MSRSLPARAGHGVFALLCCFVLAGCNKPLPSLVKGDVSHSSVEYSSYAITFPSPAEEKDFAKQMTAWCAEKGYVKPGEADLRALLRNEQPGAYQFTAVKYPDPANSGCSILITYRHTTDNEWLIGLLLTREGNNESLDRQTPLLEAQRDAFIKQFDILSRLN